MFGRLAIKSRCERANRGFPTGFTLVELLIVIAIIALLMAILMPGLRKAKKQAKTVICMTNLSQWRLVWEMYTSDYNGSFQPGFDYGYLEPSAWMWFVCLRDYYMKAGKIRLCPETSFKNPRGTVASRVWDYRGSTSGLVRNIYYGSYGTNLWIANPSLIRHSIFGGGPQTDILTKPTAYNWRTRDVKGADNIPVFAGSWCDGGWPYAHDVPRSYEEMPTHLPAAGFGPPNNMNRFCLDRHDGFVNCLFMDWSIRKVGLKELWTLKWHRQFNTRNDYTKANPAWIGNPAGLAEFWDRQAPWMSKMPVF